MRGTTERPEALDAGTVRLIGTDKHRIIDEVAELINNQIHYKEISMTNNPMVMAKQANGLLVHSYQIYLYTINWILSIILVF